MALRMWRRPGSPPRQGRGPAVLLRSLGNIRTCRVALPPDRPGPLRGTPFRRAWGLLSHQLRTLRARRVLNPLGVRARASRSKSTRAGDAVEQPSPVGLLPLGSHDAHASAIRGSGGNPLDQALRAHVVDRMGQQQTGSVVRRPGHRCAKTSRSSRWRRVAFHRPGRGRARRPSPESRQLVGRVSIDRQPYAAWRVGSQGGDRAEGVRQLRWSCTAVS
jgi:hypothetical protein